MAIIAKANAYRHKKDTFRHQKMREKWKNGGSEERKKRYRAEKGRREKGRGELFSLVVYLLISETL